MKHNHLIRIVRLTINPHEVDDFFETFDAVKFRILEFEGCHHLELLQDATFPNIVTTYSLWENESRLDAYRNSELFKDTWRKTKRMFAAPPMAFSNYQVQEVHR